MRSGTSGSGWARRQSINAERLPARRVPAFAPQFRLLSFLLAVLAAVFAVFAAFSHRTVTRRMCAFLSLCHGAPPGESLRSGSTLSQEIGRGTLSRASRRRFVGLTDSADPDQWLAIKRVGWVEVRQPKICGSPPRAAF